jgi:hypothetical protein
MRRKIGSREQHRTAGQDMNILQSAPVPQERGALLETHRSADVLADKSVTDLEVQLRDF